MSNSDTLVVMSGGLDSVTAAYHLQKLGYHVSAVSFNYGQRHKRELEFARYHTQLQRWPHTVVDMSFLGDMLESSLTGHGDVPEGHYAEDNMKATIVPNRNAIMLSVACGLAVSKGIPYIATAVHAGDHFIYPDCRPAFINHLSHALVTGNEGFKGILSPFLYLTKNDIAQTAVNLGFDWAKTWSCYKGDMKHCGRCGTCVERMEAIWSTNLWPDHNDTIRLELLFPPDKYVDNAFWMEALKTR